jgi:hypothetical protein
MQTATRSRVGAWPDGARQGFAREAGCAGPRAEQAFPSGRAAIVACLKLLGVGPESVVATPECVTECVAVAVRQVARPVPMRSALNSPLRTPEAVILYEQWGWALPADARQSIQERLANVPIIVDRVDSADFFGARDVGTFDVLSLSKVLGIAAGGIARHQPDGAYLLFEPSAADVRRSRPIVQSRQASHPAVRELFKRSQHVHPSVITWLETNCAVRAAEAERQARNLAARLVLNSSLAATWPTWMAQAIEDGAGPVWAPILRGQGPGVHWRTVAQLADDWGITSAVRLFNWTGNPLAPRFEACVALPIHSGVDGPGEVVASLARSAA